MGAAHPRPAPERLRDRLAAGLPDDVAAGVADCAGGVAGVRTAHETARQTAAVLHALGRTGRPVLAAELGVYRTLFSRAGRGEGCAFVEATLGPLLDHDRDRGRDLVPTLQAYLDHGEHHARTCEALHVHANTLYRRLDRIAALLGEGWRPGPPAGDPARAAPARPARPPVSGDGRSGDHRRHSRGQRAASASAALARNRSTAASLMSS
ncbi:PucR family transcriptional regulator [Pseudonocardia halophobica]|uniref:PucR family transcriptional regulator n=1 Tax=Pseudonocardia halophobica TaxID=29401 RepID=UPI003D8BBC26